MSRELVQVAALMPSENSGDDEFVKGILLECANRECVFHEEISAPWWGKKLEITDGAAGTEKLSRFSILLPDTRLISSIRFQSRRAALSTICQAVKPYLDAFRREELGKRICVKCHHNCCPHCGDWCDRLVPDSDGELVMCCDGKCTYRETDLAFAKPPPKKEA